MGTIGSTNSAMTYDIFSLEIFHYYTVSTACTLPCYQAQPGDLTVRAPKLALKYPFILHCILALAALQQHILEMGSDPSMNYFKRSQYHFQECVHHLSQTGLAPDNYASFPRALDWAKNILAMYALACPPEPDGDRWATKSPLEWFPLARKFLVETEIYWIKAVHLQLDPLSAIQNDILNPPSAEFLSSCLGFPRILYNIHLPDSPFPQPEEILDQGISQIYYNAVLALRDTFTMSFRPTQQWSSAFSWPSMISEPFCNFIMERRPRALLILSYYCALLSQFKYLWWIRNRGETDLITLISIVRASRNPEWLPWFEEPQQMTQQRKPQQQQANLYLQHEHSTSGTYEQHLPM